MPLVAVLNWRWPVIFALLLRRHYLVCSRCAADFIKVTVGSSDWSQLQGLATALDFSLTGQEVTAEEAYRLELVNKVVPNENLMETAEHYTAKIISNSQQAIRSAKETILDVFGRTLGDALRLETINAYSSLGDFSEARERLAQFYARGKDTGKA
jgi:enoyl-CoA hydratase/carnithine racemase